MEVNMANLKTKNSISLWLSVIGIIATFVATFLGVFLANTLDKKENELQERKNYLAYLTIMCEECRETYEINKDIDPESKVNEIRGGPFLFNAAAQNTKNLIFMDEKQVINLMRSITRSGYHLTRYHELVLGSPRVFRVTDAPTPKNGEKREAFQERYQAFVAKKEKERIEEARRQLTSWRTEFGSLCKLLNTEKEKAEQTIKE